jgi:carbonic anhydrase
MHKLTFVALSLSAVIGSVGCHHTPKPRPRIEAMNAKQDLIQGNQRFLDGDLENHTWLHEQVVETGTYGQSPSIGVLSCADSRVPLELIFDQGVGDLFVVRVAGNFEDAAAAGTFEYGVEALGVHTILVLGHTKCGAVEATLAGKTLPGNMPTFVAAIEPAIAAAGGEMTLDAAVEANVRWQQNAMLERSAILRKAADEGRMQMLGAIYDVDTGKVRFID